MNKFCIIINNGNIYPSLHHKPNPKPYRHQVDRWIFDYFKKFRNQSLRLDDYDVCEIVGEFNFSNSRLYVIKNLISDELVSIDREGVLVFGESNKNIFFDTLFGLRNE